MEKTERKQVDLNNSQNGEKALDDDTVKFENEEKCHSVPSLDDCTWGQTRTARTMVVRLLPGMHLKASLLEFCTRQNLKAAAITTCVGSLTKANVRLANGSTIKQYEGPFEIVSLVGTVAPTNCHIHIALSDAQGHMIGGHLVDNDVIFTTAEVVLTELSGLRFDRQHCVRSGWPELVIENDTSNLTI